MRSGQFAGAVHAYESALKLVHGESFEKAVKAFENLISAYPDEPEIHERAKVLIQVCEKKIQEKARTVFRSADDYYNAGIAALNRRELAASVQHFVHALKIAPRAEHVLYALAAAHALQGDREQALQFLRQSIAQRPENRFMAARDSDFEALSEDADFRQLIIAPEK